MTAATWAALCHLVFTFLSAAVALRQSRRNVINGLMVLAMVNALMGMWQCCYFALTENSVPSDTRIAIVMIYVAICAAGCVTLGGLADNKLSKL